MRTPAFCSRYFAAMLLTLLPTVPAAAAPLAKDACDQLKAEQYGLVASGLRADMAKGAAWAKANLTGDRMKSIQRLIEVDEQILFRCASQRAAAGADGEDDDDDAAPKVKPTPKPKAAKPADQAATATESGAAKASAPKDGQSTDGALKPDAAQADGTAAAAKKADDAAAKKRAAAANPKPKPKPKPAAKDDAFVPPQGAPLSVLKPPPGTEPVLSDPQ